MSLQDLLAPIEGKLADLAADEIATNADAILAAANAAGVKAIDAIVDVVVANLPHNGVFALVAPAIAAAIKKAEPELIAAAGGEEKALLAAAETAIRSFAKAHAA